MCKSFYWFINQLHWLCEKLHRTSNSHVVKCKFLDRKHKPTRSMKNCLLVSGTWAATTLESNGFAFVLRKTIKINEFAKTNQNTLLKCSKENKTSNEYEREKEMKTKKKKQKIVFSQRLLSTITTHSQKWIFMDAFIVVYELSTVDKEVS